MLFLIIFTLLIICVLSGAIVYHYYIYSDQFLPTTGSFPVTPSPALVPASNVVSKKSSLTLGSPFSPCDPSGNDEDDKITEALNMHLGQFYANKLERMDSECVKLPEPFSVFDNQTNELLLSDIDNDYAFLPNVSQIPTGGQRQNRLGYCGFGVLTFDRLTGKWGCRCHAPDYFGGGTCDDVQQRLVENNKCLKVAQMIDLLNFDVSTFNPFTEGVCVQCTRPDLNVPILNTAVPSCREMVSMEEEKAGEEITVNMRCTFDALNPHLYNNPLNEYIPGYGCACHYQGGFVEALLPSVMDNDAPTKVCIKLGKDQSADPHRVDLAYYTLHNNLRPIQIHAYTQLESPFDQIFSGWATKELLVRQESSSVADSHDWLNRNLQPTGTEVIHRLQYPKATWPVVHKRYLVNKYERRLHTHPISAHKLATGRGFEAIHWYESTKTRYLSNAVWGHPVIYTHYGDTPYTGKVTLNPLGLRHKQYYGATMLSKPGEVVRLDTRGYNQEKTPDYSVITFPPNYEMEMMDAEYIGAIPDFLYLNYYVTA